MAVVRGRKEIIPISLNEAVDSVRQNIFDISKINRTMINAYIHPDEVPADIEAYRPRLEFLYARVSSLSDLNLAKLTVIVDQAAATVAMILLAILDQLLSAINGIQQIFIQHYDRDLARTRPYDSTYKGLLGREKQLERFEKEQRLLSRQRPAESLVRVPQRDGAPAFCRYAVAFVNHRDHGKLSQVLPEDLTKQDLDMIRKCGGVFLSWDCPGCAFRLRYHAMSSVGSGIMSTDDIRSHSSAPEIQYHPCWLIKCHLYQPRSQNQRRSSTGEAQRGNRGRRQSEVSPRSSGSFWLGTSRRSKSIVNKEKTRNTNAKYGCPFCFVTGKETGHMDYRNGRELAEHVASKHHVRRAPTGLMLEKFHVGVDGKCADTVGKWELNIRSRRQ